MRFPYQPYRGFAPSPADRSTTAYRPAIQVRVIGLVGDLNLWGILDTGAMECVLPFEVLDAVEPARRPDDEGWIAGYVGEGRPVPYGTVDLEIILKGKPRRWSAKVAFDPERRGEALWGMVGFLEHFAASFDSPERHVTLRLKGKPPRPVIPHDV